jgi:hypothetical protein
MSRYLRDCRVDTNYGEHDYKRVGVMLGDVVLSKKKRPDVVDALVALTAARHDPAAVFTCDEGDITAYLNTIPRTRVVVIPL